jgi:hypothetical protein
MPVFKLPLSGDVVQNISPFTAFMSPIGSQFGLINITLGQSSDPDVEKDVLSDYGTYGKQIGQISEALLVLIEACPTTCTSTANQRSRSSRNCCTRWPTSNGGMVERPCVRKKRHTMRKAPTSGDLVVAGAPRSAGRSTRTAASARATCRNVSNGSRAAPSPGGCYQGSLVL